MNYLTHEDLIADGWQPKECKVGTLYFKGDFFGGFRGEVFELRSMMDDMTPIGNAITFNDIRQVQQHYYRSYIEVCEQRLKDAKEKLAALNV